MSVFEDALWISGEQWIESFPADLPKHKFSRKHNRVINGILHGNQEKTKVKLSKGTIKILLITSILLAFATTVFAVPAGREYIVEKFFNHAEYTVINAGDLKKVTSLKLNYIPAGFEKTEDYGYAYIYENIDKSFLVQKCELSTLVGFDTENYDCENITINGFDAIFYRSLNEFKGIIFNNGEYIFLVDGNIEKDELVKIAQNLN